jgi:hypothetical protein
MKKTITVKTKKEVELKTLTVAAGVRYWEDTKVNGVEDTEGKLIPCVKGDYWCPVIDIETGIITNWKQGVTANVHYKVCDDGIYTVQDADGNNVLSKEGYVPDTMCPAEEGYGDYIIMMIDANGQIENWNFNPDDFNEAEDEEQ